MARPSGPKPHPLFNVRLGSNDRWLLVHAPSPHAILPYVLEESDRSTREGLRRAAAKLGRHRLLTVQHQRVYVRARDNRREGLLYHDGKFWTRPDPTRAHAVRRNVVWRSEFGEQIVQRYRFELSSGRPIRWDSDAVALAERVARWRGGDPPHVDDVVEERESNARDAALFGERPSLALELALPPQVAPGARDRWLLASLLARHRAPSATVETIWDDAQVLFAEFNYLTLEEAVKNEIPHLTRLPSRAKQFRRRRRSPLGRPADSVNAPEVPEVDSS